MSNLKTPFRYDYVGSFLRPAKLKKARADYEAGTISAEQLKSVEDEVHYTTCQQNKRAWISCDHRWRVQKSNMAFGFYVGISRDRT